MHLRSYTYQFLQVYTWKFISDKRFNVTLLLIRYDGAVPGHDIIIVKVSRWVELLHERQASIWQLLSNSKSSS